MLPAIRVEHLSKYYRLDEVEKTGHTLSETIMGAVTTPWRMLRNSYRSAVHANGYGAANAADIFWALRDVSFEVQPGEVVAVIGPNGAGKSTLFKILSRITKPTSGLVEVRGRLGSLLEVGTGFHPELTGRENVFLYGAILGMTQREVERKFDEIVAFAEIDQFIDMPVKRYSSGMHMRLAFAVAAHLEPDILLLDEVMAVGDAEFQEKSQKRIRYLTGQGITTLIISHSSSEVELLAKRCLYIRSGAVEFDGAPAAALELYTAHMHQEMSEATSAEPGTEEVPPPPEEAPPPNDEVTMPFEQDFEVPEFLASESEAAGAQPLEAPADAPSDAPSAEPPPHEILGLEAINSLGGLEIVQGEHLHVWVHYRTSFIGVPVAIQISIWTEHDVLVMMADTRHGPGAEPPEGEYGVALCTFRSLPLNPGVYLVRAIMFHPEVEGEALAAFGLEGDPRTCAFVIRPPGEAGEMAEQWPTESGLIAVPFEWSKPNEPMPPSAEPPAPESAVAPAAPLSQPPQAVNIAVNSGQAVHIAFHFAGRGTPPMQLDVNADGVVMDTEKESAGPPLLLAQPASDPFRPPLPADLRQQWVSKEPNSVIGFMNYAMRINNGLEFYNLFKDIFYHRIYRFSAKTPDPVIVDGGSHIGMAILYFKHLYPRARVIGFEADPRLFRILQENVKRNGLNDVTLINAALGAKADTRAFPGPAPGENGAAAAEGTILVQERPLSEFIQEPIDFLKLTLDGNELAVLQELATSGKLSQVQQLVLEYTSRGADAQRLGALLELLTRQGFRYLIHDYDAETNLATKPPFRLLPETTWYCLVYARQMS